MSGFGAIGATPAGAGDAQELGALLTSPLPIVQSSGNQGLFCPIPIVEGLGRLSNSAILNSSPPTIRAAGGGTALLVMPSVLLEGAGNDTLADYFAASLSSPSLTAFGGANSALTMATPVVTIAATVFGLGKAILAAPLPVIQATGRVSAVGSASFEMPVTELIGYFGGVVSVTIGTATVAATGSTGSIGGATITLPLFELTASGTAQSRGSADLIMPAAQLGVTAQAYLIAPGAQLTAVGSAVVTATYEAYSINLNRALDRAPTNDAVVNEVARYTNFPFTQIVRYQNSYFGVAADGLYLLEGTTDNGAPIAYGIKTCATDFGAPEKKTVASVYLGARMGPSAALTLYVGEKGPQAYNYTTPRDTAEQNYRQKFGRGVKSRYYALGVSGTDAMELDTIDFDVVKLTRRI